MSWIRWRWYTVVIWHITGLLLQRDAGKVTRMAKKTEHLGQESGQSSDKFLSPSKPYTGDGKTSREPADRVELDRPARDPNK